MLHKKLKDLDEVLKTLGLDVKIELGNLTLALTDESTDNHRLVDFGLAGQKITILKNQ